MIMRIVGIGVLIVLCAAFIPSAPAAAEELFREKLRNDVGIELLGKAALYCFYYQYMPNRMLGLEAGFGVLGGGSGDDNATIAFFPLGVKLYLIPKNGSLYLTGGVTIVTAGTDTGPFDESTTYGYAGPGFEFRAESGFIFRGTAYGLFSGDGFFIWPGLTIGYAF
ncbi:MAG: hypothetical protein PHQ19_05700 [Candidatus Krumholzibacteria bacterium]|nr:hypothetical protein [Candidatus Krumholzibacteria bacterium]